MMRNAAARGPAHSLSQYGAELAGYGVCGMPLHFRWGAVLQSSPPPPEPVPVTWGGHFPRHRGGI